MTAPNVRRRIRLVALLMAAVVAGSVPVLSTYGLAVCPVLLPLGFRFGCSYLVMFAVMIASVGFLAKLVRFPRPYLLPIILTFCIAGAFVTATCSA